MTRIVLMPEVFEDLQRILGHLEVHDSAHRVERIKDIVSALDVLAGSPMVGRMVATERRELVIGRDVRGYVALYRYDSALDCVFVIAVRAQRELGYAREESGSST